MKRIVFCSFVLFINACNAAYVDTVSIFSNAMHKSFKCVVIKPSSYHKSKQAYPVVYLLHGYEGWYSNWIIREPKLKNYADVYNLLVVCPDGGKASWYLDSPLDPTMKYETYISAEVPEFIDKHYKTIKSRSARAITGLSMGGHGALFIAFRHADIFGACGSISGLMDLRFTGQKYELQKRIGDMLKFADNWEKLSVVHVIENYPKDSLAIIIDCGLNDMFYTTNRQLHEKLLELKIPHDYTERPGKHEWAYWKNSIQYHLLFFSNYFRLREKE
jgi:S-formylglutathione hydrolase FrmB